VAVALSTALPGAAIAQAPGRSAVPAAPSPAAGAPSTAPAASAASAAVPVATGTWFDGLVTGACFEITLDGQNRIDFGAPPRIVDCAQPHANEVAGVVPLGDGPEVPANVDQLAIDGCAAVVTAFLGRPVEEIPNLLFPFPVWPDASDWSKGVRQAVCSVAGNGLIGTVSSGSLRAPGETLGVFWQESDSAELWLLDAGTGEPLRALTGADTSELLGPPAWAPDGSSLLFAAQFADDDTDVFRAAADGSGVEPVIVGPGRQEGGDVSPDGESIAFIDNSGGGEYEIRVAPSDGSSLGEAITDHPERDATPRWSPDGSMILFRRVTDGVSEIWVMGADGSDPRRVVDTGGPTYDPRWTPDGAGILFTTEAGGSMDIWTAALDGSGARQLTTHPGAEEYPTFSRDGRFIAFMSDRMGVPTTWIMNADGSDASLLASISPAGYPAFAPVALEE
jgi:dipeptidyl aminopeptidase/acylaminoacyl peptidase